MTSDAWKSFAKQSYVGLTCHLINQKGELQNFLLSTTEIEKRHTSQNLREHIQTELVKWGLEYDSVTTNFNQTNENDIQSQTENIEGGVDYLKEVEYYDEDTNDDEESDQQLTTTISKLIELEERE